MGISACHLQTDVTRYIFTIPRKLKFLKIFQKLKESDVFSRLYKNKGILNPNSKPITERRES